MGSFNHKDYDYVVGIDFGTTYSGCSYAFTRASNQEIEDIAKWPKQTSNFYSKTPTVLLYEVGASTTEWWGENAHKNFWFSRGYLTKKLITRFKLLLNNDESVPELPPGLEVEGVIRDYLKGFHGFVASHLSKTLGSIYNEEKVRYCLTVPAGWTDHAKIIMRNAAIEAGIIRLTDHPERLTLISEPEAAALYCQRYCDEFDLSDGEQFLICDAGGGTVDLVVFEIEGDGSDRQLKEITTAKGENCGSTFLDVKMQALLKARIGKYIPINLITLEEMTKSFVENHKPNFGEEDLDNDIYFDVPSVICREDEEKLKLIGIEDHKLPFLEQELKDHVFEPVISRIIQLINQQLQHPESKKPMSAMFMVGGFSQSPYLQKRIRQEFEGRINLICLAPRGELAIVRGAVLLGIQPNIVSQRIAKYTYGIQTRDYYDPLRDPPKFRLAGTEFCDVRFMTIVKKNQKLPNNHIVSQIYTINRSIPTRIAIYAYDNDDIIPRWTISEKGIEVKKVGEFILDVPADVDYSGREDQPLQVDFYFGTTEIKVVLDETTTFTLAY
ncbi:hypothetical protein BDF21DRAFT_355507 [Thamnidium elegans]|uniref:Uncharacterized protein n=1 Tax=Thamnidium elegans TaxID=101142 RepID=A0A8H7SWZ8_9FUNG|nr:hypothetical protein INT48_008569 [Thamnidium elegans]KAI8094703.1 hypothetical protein BDF21DRAFT_355507 [Thamnidium elegans]